MTNTCFFIGHADAGMDIYDSLVCCIEKHITKYGVRHFMIGHYGSFDSMAASAVQSLKAVYDGIDLTLLLPYHPAEKRLEIQDHRFDESLYPFDRAVHPRYAIVKANQYAIDHADYLICYVRHVGKARDFLDYAKQREKKGLIHIDTL